MLQVAGDIIYIPLNCRYINWHLSRYNSRDGEDGSYILLYIIQVHIKTRATYRKADVSMNLC